MVTSMIMKKVANKISEEHPTVHRRGCINALKGYEVCTTCSEICVNGVYPGTRGKYENCTNCNICTVRCPTQTIMPSTSLIQQVKQCITNNDLEIHICCHKQNGRGDLKVYCLA